MDLIQTAWPYVVGSSGLIGVGSLLARWVIRVERGFDRNAAVLDLVVEKLNGHAAVDEARHDALDHRLNIIERSVGVAPAKARL